MGGRCVQRFEFFTQPVNQHLHSVQRCGLVAKDLGVPLELSPLIVNIFKDAASKYGPREFSPNIIRRYEEPCGVKVLGEGFPSEMTDDQPEGEGYEVIPFNRRPR